jgi:hypothetical protein
MKWGRNLKNPNTGRKLTSRCRISPAGWCDDVQVLQGKVWKGWWGARLGRGLLWRGLVRCLSCRGPRSLPTSLVATSSVLGRRFQSHGRCKPSSFAATGDCTWIRAAHLGSRARKPGPGVRLSQIGERAWCWHRVQLFLPALSGRRPFLTTYFNDSRPDMVYLPDNPLRTY